MTNAQLKADIDSAITNETTPASVTPTDVGVTLKLMVDYSDKTLQQTVDLGNTFVGTSGTITLRGQGIDVEDFSGDKSSSLTYDSLYFNNGVNQLRVQNNLGSANRDISFPDASGTVALTTQLPTVSGNYANDSAAASAGILVGGMYHSSGNVKIRLA